MTKKILGPRAPGWRRGMMGQYVRHLNTTARLSQMFGRWLPARCSDQWACHEDEI